MSDLTLLEELEAARSAVMAKRKRSALDAHASDVIALAHTHHAGAAIIAHVLRARGVKVTPSAVRAWLKRHSITEVNNG